MKPKLPLAKQIAHDERKALSQLAETEEAA